MSDKKRLEIWKKIQDPKADELPDFSLEESLNIIIQEFIGYGKKTILKAIDTIEAKIDNVREILLSKFKVKLGEANIRIKNLEEKLTRTIEKVNKLQLMMQ